MDRMEEIKEERFADMSNSELTMEAKRLTDAHTALKTKLALDLERGWDTLLEFEARYAHINRVLKNRNV
jgi:hypothetical protein